MSELDRTYAQLERLSKSYVVKSADGKPVSEKVAKALAITRATTSPEGATLARRILQLESQQIIKAQFAPIIKSMGLAEEEEDRGWPCEKMDEDDDEEQILHKLEQLKNDAEGLMRQLNAVRRRG